MGVVNLEDASHHLRWAAAAGAGAGAAADSKAKSNQVGSSWPARRQASAAGGSTSSRKRSEVKLAASRRRHGRSGSASLGRFMSTWLSCWEN